VICLLEDDGANPTHGLAELFLEGFAGDCTGLSSLQEVTLLFSLLQACFVFVFDVDANLDYCLWANEMPSLLCPY